MSNRIIDLLEAGELEDGDVKAVEVDGLPKLAVYRLEDTFYVTDDKCTHGEASLSEGWLEDNCIECPIHAGQFDIRTGEAVCFPVTVAIRTYKTWLEEGRIKIDPDRDAAGALVGQPATQESS